jgi:hypothetical protein
MVDAMMKVESTDPVTGATVLSLPVGGQDDQDTVWKDITDSKVRCPQLVALFQIEISCFIPHPCAGRGGMRQ